MINEYRRTVYLYETRQMRFGRSERSVLPRRINVYEALHSADGAADPRNRQPWHDRFEVTKRQDHFDGNKIQFR